MRELLRRSGQLDDWIAFAGQLERSRARRVHGRRRTLSPAPHAAYAVAPAGLDRARQPHQPHFQALDYNPLNGGVARWFEPVEPPRSASGATLGSDSRVLPARSSDSSGAGDAGWHIEVHQFRIEARAGEQGRPTPEGLHRDGVDYVLVLLVDRQNIASGVTTIHALDGRPLGHFTLTHPVRRGARRRHPRRARRDAGRADQPSGPCLPRRAGHHVQKALGPGL